MRYHAALVILGLMGLGTPAHAQTPAPIAHDPPFVHGEAAKISLLPDGNYVFNFLPASDLVFEAWVAPDVHVVDNVAAQLDRVLDGSRKRLWAYSAFGTFMVRLRMFDEDSNPVRTPSYMPKATVQFAAFRDISRGVDTERPDRRVAMWLIDIVPFGHHSNGQNGCLFTGDSRVDGECMAEVELPVNERTVNTDNGSFSTNYIRTGLHYRRMYLASASDIPFAVTRWQWGVGAHIEINPTWYPIGGAISDDLHAIYGATRARISASAARLHWRRFGRVEGKLALEYIHDAPPAVSDVTTIGEVMLLPRGWGGAGIFARFYHGQDYYNLAFFNNVSRLQVGLAFNHDKFLMFRQHLTQ
jgi:hypothetical protein